MPQVNHQKILLAVFVILIFAIPTGSYLVKQKTNLNAGASSSGYIKTVTQESSLSSREVPKQLPSLDDLRKQLENKQQEASSSSPSPEESSSPLVSFGPTLNFKIQLEGRPADNQSVKKFFVGIAQGQESKNPTYLLSFSVDIPASGVLSDLSLAGLNVNDTYTAYLKGSAQIATASSFIVKPTVTQLNSGLPLTLTTGDLNEDNSINTTDYTIAKQAIGQTSSSSSWNANIDFNLDNIINMIDLSIVRKNLGKVGAGSVYISAPPATHSAILIHPNTGGLQQTSTASGGYWMWIPNLSR